MGMNGEAVHALYIRLKSTDGAWIAPPKLRAMLVAEAKKNRSNLHDVAVGVLSASLAVSFEPSGRQTTPARDAEELNLRVGEGLWRALGAAAATSRQRAALDLLAAHYGLRMPVKPKRAPRPRAARGAV